MPAFTTRKLVRFQHCDPAGIVFYPQYFILINEIVEDWFQGPLGISWRTMHIDEHIGVPVKKTTVEFFAPSTLSETLDCSLAVDKVGASSLALTITLACGGELRAVCNHLLVRMSTSGKKAVPFPEELRARMAAFSA